MSMDHTVFSPAMLMVSLLNLALLGLLILSTILLIRALCKFLRAKPVRDEKHADSITLGAAIRQQRTSSRMTQEFVAEALGVSRQAVSKWESGASDPSTANLLSLARLFGISAEELLRQVRH